MQRSLSKGNTGKDVSELQAALNFHIRAPEEPLKPDGIFGPKTEARVRRFQKLADVTSDGIVGPITLPHLYRSAAGVVDAGVLRRATMARAPVPAFQLRPGMGFNPVRVGPVIPDKIPKLLLTMPQARAAQSVGFHFESKLVFNPLADGKSDHRLQFTITPEVPWPIFLPVPLSLDVETGVDAQGRPTVDGKIKVPFKLKLFKVLELKPYFFLGAGAEANSFKGINPGAGANLRLRVFRDILSLEADGGGKVDYHLNTGEAKLKGFFTAGVVLSF
jgi:hypothetical protein